jgi:hypothetical protein
MRTSTLAGLLGRLAPPPMLTGIAAGLDVPEDVRPHLEAVLKEIAKRSSAELSGADVLAVAVDARTTAIVVVPRCKDRSFAREMGIAEITRELATPVPLGRLRITLTGPGGGVYFAGVQLAHLGRGGQA